MKLKVLRAYKFYWKKIGFSCCSAELEYDKCDNLNATFRHIVVTLFNELVLVQTEQSDLANIDHRSPHLARSKLISNFSLFCSPCSHKKLALMQKTKGCPRLLLLLFYFGLNGCYC